MAYGHVGHVKPQKKPKEVTADVSVRAEGPWEHRNLSAGGASFHVAISGEGAHDVILLHDFPLYWWSWRSQLPALAQAGYRAIALDMRGFGGSDFQPGEVPFTRLATDVTSVLRSLGSQSYTVVGAGMGGTVAWTLAHQHPSALTSVVTVGAPHPLSTFRATPATKRVLRSTGFPRIRRRLLMDGDLVRRSLTLWTGPESDLTPLVPTYAKLLQRRVAADAAWETYEATHRIPLTHRSLFERRATVPVWSIRGESDPKVPPSAYADDAKHVKGGVNAYVIARAGHYLNEEAPSALTTGLLEHLQSLS